MNENKEYKRLAENIKYLLKSYDDVFMAVAQHKVLYGHITEEDIERIVNASLSKND
jgi:hypothetical protein